MDEVEKRMRDASDNCVKNYEAWRKDQKDGKARENLMEAVHELRKVAARLEIEIAISEREEMTARHIPIPPHRSARRTHGGGDFPDDSVGNAMPDSNESQSNNSPRDFRGGQHFRQRRHGGGGGGGRSGGGGGHHGGGGGGDNRPQGGGE